MTFYRVDLLDQDGGIASTAAAEVNFWNADSSQAEAYAEQAGYTLQVSTTLPPGVAERNLYAFGDFQQWLASQNTVSATPGTPNTSTGELAVAVGVGVALTGLLVLAVRLLR